MYSTVHVRWLKIILITNITTLAEVVQLPEAG